MHLLQLERQRWSFLVEYLALYGRQYFDHIMTIIKPDIVIVFSLYILSFEDCFPGFPVTKYGNFVFVQVCLKSDSFHPSTDFIYINARCLTPCQSLIRICDSNIFSEMLQFVIIIQDLFVKTSWMYEEKLLKLQYEICSMSLL